MVADGLIRVLHKFPIYRFFPHNHDLGLERMVRKKRKYQASVSSLGEKNALLMSHIRGETKLVGANLP